MTHVIPPAQADQPATRHVLDSPEVECKQRNDDNKVEDEVVADEEAEQVRDDGSDLEEHVEVHRLGIPVQIQ